MRVAFFTLGCKVNQFETQALELLFKQRGHEVTKPDEECDAVIVNTCTVTAVSDKKSRQTIRRMRREHQNAILAVCGCFPQVNPEGARSIEGIDIIAGTGDREKLVALVEHAFSGHCERELLDNALNRRDYEILPAGGLIGHTRAMLKVQDGCSNFCAYCIIPYTRGPVRSMSLENAALQAKRLAADGYREIVITGIEISSYGIDLNPRVTVIDIIEEVCGAVPDVRIRLGSLEPRTITREFCTRLSAHKNLCPHFHLSLQSGCNETLARMRRKYDTKLFNESIKMLREEFKSCAITTDLIVGFPGETEEEFNKTIAFIEQCKFSDMHIFPYSKRAGTPAAVMQNQVTRAVKEERAHRAAAAANKMNREYLKSYIGKSLSVLWEKQNEGYWEGHAVNYIKVYLNSEDMLKNHESIVKILGLYQDGLMGEI